MGNYDKPEIRIVSPCVKECIDRCAGCAVYCAAWKAYVLERDKLYQTRLENYSRSYATEATIRAFKRADRRKRRQRGYNNFRNRGW